MASRSSNLVFETDVNMDGLLSDSNDSSSSSTENNLSTLMGCSLTNPQLNNNHTSILNHQNQMMYQQATMQSIESNNNSSTGPNPNSDKRKNDSLGQLHGDMMPTKKIPPANGKKTKGRVKIKMEFIDNKLRRYTTFSKRKTGIMKKAYELSTLTGTQVMLLVASETGHVYTFATRKLQPMITSDAGKALIQTCLNSPDVSNGVTDQRMSATGFEETDLTYTVNEDSSEKEQGSSNDVNSSLGSSHHVQHHHQPHPDLRPSAGSTGSSGLNHSATSSTPTHTNSNNNQVPTYVQLQNAVPLFFLRE